MEIILLAVIAAITYLIVATKLLGIKRVVRFQVILDTLVTLVAPLAFLGTFSGMVLCVLAGFFFSVFLWIIGRFVKVEPLIQKRKT